MINIAFCTDDNYANHCAVCVTSILENNKGDECQIYVLTEGLSDENMKKYKYLSSYYQQNVDIFPINSSLFDHLQVSERLPRSIYFRFLLPHLIEGDRVLYLDCDIIVRKSLGELFSMDLNNVACAVVEDQCGDDIRIHNRIKMFSRYFNSGVLLMNMDYWRKNDITEKLIQYIQDFPGTLECPDQDALNVILENKVYFLDYQYNLQELMFGNRDWLRADKWAKLDSAVKDPVVLHYTSGVKPWHKDCSHPMKEEYDKYMMKHECLWEKKDYRHPLWYYCLDGIVNKFKQKYNQIHSNAASSRS